MSDDMSPWEPPFARTEIDHLVGSLERLRATFRWKAGGLDAEGLGSNPDWEFTYAADDSSDDLYELWDTTIERSSRRLAEAIDDGRLDQEVAWGRYTGISVSVRRLVCDLIEAYGRHTGLCRSAARGRRRTDRRKPALARVMR